MAMAAEEDPFSLVQEEVNAQLVKVGSQMKHWNELCASSSEMDATEATHLRLQLTSTLNDLKQDLQDMQATVEIASGDPAKFGIAPAELKRRREYVSKTTREVGVYAETLANYKSAAKLQKSARKERTERLGLLADPGASSCDMAAGAASSVEALANHSGKQRDVYQQHEQALQQQTQIREAAVAEQDQQLGILSGTMTRLGDMGRMIKDELVAQGKALDELTEDVDATAGRMKQATAVMNKMLNSKDRGKFCMIIFLTLTLGVLLFLIFGT